MTVKGYFFVFCHLPERAGHCGPVFWIPPAGNASAAQRRQRVLDARAQALQNSGQPDKTDRNKSYYTAPEEKKKEMEITAQRVEKVFSPR